MEKRKIIKDLQSDPRLMGECPKCEKVFSLKKATIFHIADPIIPEAKKWLEEYKSGLSERETDLKIRKKRLKEHVPKITETINRGKILEKLVPAFTEVKYNLQDYRPLFEPIDYILFEGISKKSKVESVKFIDCKSGGAGLNKHQKQIKTTVDNSDIIFENY